MIPIPVCSHLDLVAYCSRQARAGGTSCCYCSPYCSRDGRPRSLLAQVPVIARLIARVIARAGSLLASMLARSLLAPRRCYCSPYCSRGGCGRVVGCPTSMLARGPQALVGTPLHKPRHRLIFRHSDGKPGPNRPFSGIFYLKPSGSGVIGTTNPHLGPARRSAGRILGRAASRHRQPVDSYMARPASRVKGP